MTQLFFKKFLEMFGVYTMQGQSLQTGLVDWLSVADLALSLAIGVALTFILVRATRDYLSHKGTTPDLFMGIVCVIGLVMVCVRSWVTVTFQAYQYMSVIYGVCGMMSLYYFSLMLLYSPTIVDAPKERQMTRVVTVLFMAAVSIFFYSNIEYQSSSIMYPRDRSDLAQSAIEPLLQIECVSIKSFLPNILQCVYCTALCVIMMVHLKKTKMHAVHQWTYLVVILAYVALCANSLNKIFYANYADLRQSRLNLDDFAKSGPTMVNTCVFQAMSWFYGLKDDLTAPQSAFLGVHNVIVSFAIRITYFAGFALNAKIMLDNKSIKKLEERQLKRVKTYRVMAAKMAKAKASRLSK